MRSCRASFLWGVLAGAVLLSIVAVGTGVAYYLIQQRQSDLGDWQEPISAVVPRQVRADLALYPLAGALELETIDAAISNGDLETAFAAIAYGQNLTDAQRVGRLLLLGRRFDEAGQPDMAALTYQQVYDVAVLSLDLHDPSRADALFSAGKGWAAAGRRAKAVEAYDQVFLLAVRSPYLPLAHRRDLLTMLEKAYDDLGDSAQARVSRQRIVELDQAENLQLPLTPGQAPDLTQGAEEVSTPEIGALEETRRQAAYALLQGLADGAKPPPDLVNALGQALQAEDMAKLDLYRRELEATAQLGKRVGLHWQMITWLTLKYRIAEQGFGISLVPEWEAQAADIQSALSKAYEDLYFDYEDLVASLPEASLIAPGSYAVRRSLVQAGRLGHYPNYPAPQLAEKLRDAASTLIAEGLVDQLYVDTLQDGQGSHFFLSPADQYGTRSGSPSDD